MIKLKSTKSLILTLFHSSAAIYRKIFCKRTIILISKDKIRNIEISPIFQVSLVAVALFISNLLYQSVMFHRIISIKSERISDLENINKKFRKELIGININLGKINDYFVTSYGYEKELNPKGYKGLHDQAFDKLFANLNLEKSDRKTAIEIANAHVILDNIKSMAKQRIASLEDEIMKTGIVLDKAKANNKHRDNDLMTLSLNTESELSKQGGPLDLIYDNDNENSQPIDIASIKIDDEMSYLSNLEKFIYHAPLNKPMKDYYVSSTFGSRVDPIKKVMARHEGMDFVGQNQHAKVLSPSVGKVKFAGNSGAYGNMIIIDHGYGITSRYGHLSKINIKTGDVVKKGDVLGLQGSTGRSTGSHLHYEVRYNNTPLNPRKFLEAGNGIFGAKNI